MKMLLILAVSWCECLFAQVQPLLPAHAHNDYEHERPLLDALDNGFLSVEADVWCVDGTLYVYHDLPSHPDPARTLENLYLQPLAERVGENGKVYPGYKGFFYLMIDIKGNPDQTYSRLQQVLAEYSSMISVVQNGNEEDQKPVKVFLSGNRPLRQILQARETLMALDGRPDDLGQGIPSQLMPVVSENFHKFSSWNGSGPMKKKDLANLTAFIEKVHAENKKVRLWAAPDNPESWKLLLDLGVDLINTDKLQDFRASFLSQNLK